MLYALLTGLLILCIYAPQGWVRYVMHRYSTQIDDMPGTGGELAEHLIERFGLDGVKVERLPAAGDHFDPIAKAVRLSADNYDGKSITAVAVATHEVGHAIQFVRKEAIFRWRSRAVPLGAALTKAGVLVFMAMPIIGLLLRSPAAMAVAVGVGLVLQLLGACAHLILLPEEWDASFGKAMPILIEGDYVPEQHQDSIRRVLKAAAFTYFAGALASMLSIGRWLLVLRR